MKKVIFCGIGVLIVSFLWGRIFFVGSNPYLSLVAFPQDLLQWEKSFFAVGLSYQCLPWWGDVDNPTNRPNESYTSTEDSVSFPPQPGDSQNSYFQNYGATHVMGVNAQYFVMLEKDLRLFFKFFYTPSLMHLSAKGNLRGETNGEVHFIPFEYEVSHVVNAIGAEGVVAGKVSGLPVGLKVGFSYENTGSLEHDFRATVNGTPINSDRLFWGWTTVGCNHIFGYRSINGDAWFQDSYLIGPEWKWDFQGGITFPKARFGNRLRLFGSLQKEYNWETSSKADTLLETNFMGSYEINPYLWKTEGWLNRTYANVTFLEGDRWKFNTLFFFGIDGASSTFVASNDLSASVGRKNNVGGVLLEVNPNVSMKPSKEMSMDIGILLTAEWHRNEWLDGYYNPFMRASKETWVNSQAYVGPEYQWENFSYVDTFAYHVGFDAIFYLPLYGDKNQQVGLVVNIFENTQFSWLTKHYGTNRFTAQETVFDDVTLRETFKREVWFHTMIGVSYRRAPYHIRVEVLQPLLYTVYSHQRLRSKEKGLLLYEFEKSQNWAVQEGLALRVTVGYEL